MTIKNLALAAVALCALSCTDFDNGFTETDAYKNHLIGETLDEYTANFEARFGKIDPNHNWGFGPIDVPVTRAQVDNKNQWESDFHLQVPGWPIVYVDKDGNTHVTTEYRNGDGGSQSISSTKTSVPGGDVTDEEVAYVSWWFRTHRYPTSLNVHWSDFFLQEVSADKDRNSDGNVVTRVAEYEDKSDYLVQTNQGAPTFEIDQLFVEAYDGGTVWDHMKNFNANAANSLRDKSGLYMGDDYDWQDYDKYPKDTESKRMIDFFYCSGTEDWAAHYSNDETWRYNGNNTFSPDGVYSGHRHNGNDNIWVIVHLHFIGKSGHIYDNYYIGFDYAFESVNGSKTQFLKADGYYSNWILKISPAIPIINNPLSRRIMCEDLGNTLDLDFDDVVFDATVNGNSVGTDGKYDVTINLMAAGGTMPIWIGVDPEQNLSNKYEVHKLFGANSYSKPINVASSSISAPIANYHIKMDPVEIEGELKPDFDKIGIWVYNTKGHAWIPLSDVQSAIGNHSTPQNQPESGKNYAPQKFATPINVKWLIEEQQIEWGYPHFIDWVRDENGTYREGGESPWFNTEKNTRFLCGQDGQIPINTSPTPGSIMDNGQSGTTSSWRGNAGLNYSVYAKANNDEYGTINITGQNSIGTFDKGSKATLTAQAKPGYTFVGWSGDKTSNDVTIEITMDGEKYVMANFDYAGRKTNISVTSNSYYFGGTSGPMNCIPGKQATIEAFPQEYCKFVNWTLNGSVVSTNASYTITVPETDCEYVANFTVDETKFEADALTFDEESLSYSKADVNTYLVTVKMNSSFEDATGYDLTISGVGYTNLEVNKTYYYIIKDKSAIFKSDITGGLANYIATISVKPLKQSSSSKRRISR